MSNNSWKQYGGIRNEDRYKNISFGTIIADQLLLREKFSGVYTIQGSIDVKQDVLAIGSVRANADISANYNLYIGKNAYINNKLFFGTNTTIEDGNTIYPFLYGNSSGIGVNTMAPTSVFDIAGLRTNVLTVRSNQGTNVNIIAQNQNTKGVVVGTSDTQSYIEFHNDTITTAAGYNSRIQSQSGGTLSLLAIINSITSTANSTITSGAATNIVSATTTNINSTITTNIVSPATNLLSTLLVSKRNTPSNILNETAIIYDNSSGNYLYDVYEDSQSKTGNALTLVANDTSSNTFMNIITPNQRGLSVGGGSYTNDKTRSMGTFGVKDVCGNYVLNQMIVSGNNVIKNTSTMGINTFAPRTENYVLDVNGPIHIGNGEINKVSELNFEIKYAAFSKINNTYGIAVGTPSEITSPFRQFISYTNNAGQTWNLSRIDDTVGGFESSQKNFNSIFVYDSNYAIIGSTSSFIYYTANGGQGWTSLFIDGVTKQTTAIYVGLFSGSTKRVFITYTTTTALLQLVYFNFDFNSTSAATPTTITPSITSISASDGYGNSVYFVGAGIQKYNIQTVSSQYVAKTTNTYNAIAVYNDNYAVAVGTNIISYTTDGTNWVDVPTPSSLLRSVYIFNVYNAVAVGDAGVFLYTTNGFSTWTTVPNSILNSSGYASRINNSSNMLKSVTMYDINSIIISNVKSTYGSNSSSGLSKIYYCYLPNLFNRTQNTVIDVSGNMVISGDLNINDSGKIISNNSSFQLLNENVQTIQFGGNASRLYIGNSLGGNTYLQNDLVSNGKTTNIGDVSMNSRLYVGKDASFNSNVYINRDLKVNGNLYVNQYTSKQTITAIDYQFIVAEDMSLNGRLYVSGDVSMNGNLMVKSITLSGGTIYGYSTPTSTPDTWLLTNLINPPPAVIFGTPTSKPGFIFIPWTYPTQIHVGAFSANYLPIINDMIITYGSSANSTVKTLVDTKTGTPSGLTKTNYINTDPSNVISNAFNTSSTPITGVILAKSFTDTTYGTVNTTLGSIVSATFPGDVGTRRAYLWYDSNLAAFTTTTQIYLHVYYKNYNNYYNDIYTTNAYGFSSAGPPSAPRNLAFSTAASSSIQITYSAPLYGNASALDNTIQINDYKVTYNAISNGIRYGGLVSSSGTSNTTSTSPTLSSIYPDASYNIYVQASNTVNPTAYGVSGGYIISSTLPLTSPTTNYDLTGIFPTTNLTTNAYYSVKTATQVPNLIVEGSATSRTTSSFDAIINDFTTRGIKGYGNSMTLSVSISGAKTVIGPTVTYDASFTASTPSASTTNGITISPQSISDNYSGTTGSDGYYRKASTQITLGTSVLTPTSEQYVVTVQRTSTGQTSTGGSTTYSGNNYSFYYDNLSNNPGTPSIIGFSLNTTSSMYVCGIQVIYGQIQFDASYSVTNLGNYFYKNPLINYSSSVSNLISATETSIPDKTNNTTSNKLNATVNFTSRTITSSNTTSNSIFTTSIPIMIQANNIIGSTSITYGTPIAAIIDGPSYTLAYSTFSTTTIPNIGTTSVSTGTRIWSGTTPGTFNSANILNGSTSYSALGTLYDHSQPINGTGNYSNELQIANGKITTKGSTTTAYLNYSTLKYSSSGTNTLNYSGIDATSGTYRYATFAWKIPANTSATYSSVTLTINGTSSTPTVNSSGITAYTSIGGENLKLYYRVEDATSAGTLAIASSISTDWISANYVSGGTLVSSSNYTNTSYEPFNGIARTGGITGTTYKVLIPAATWSSSSYLYCRIGLPMAQTFSFTTVSAQLGTDTA
jgi:hypothetical protein